MAASHIVLASASPRRRRLIGWLGLGVHTLATDTEEDLAQPLEPQALAMALAEEKALSARASGARETILAFDTIVVHEGAVLGKPLDAEDARRMLRELSGGLHEVITGVALHAEGALAPHTFPVVTRVRMHPLDDAAIDTWIAGGEALGCAGAYNIEHHLASVDDDECFQNVAGLPLCHVYRELASGVAGMAHHGLTAPFTACDQALGRRCLLGPVVCAENTADRRC